MFETWKKAGAPFSLFQIEHAYATLNKQRFLSSVNSAFFIVLLFKKKKTAGDDFFFSLINFLSRVHFLHNIQVI